MVARGFRRADAPARRRRTRFQILRRPHKKKRQAGIGGSEMQPLARFQIELVDKAGNGGRRARTQRLFQRPERVAAVRRLHQEDVRRVETQCAQSMTVETAVFAKPIGGQDEDELSRFSLSPWGVGKTWTLPRHVSTPTPTSRGKFARCASSVAKPRAAGWA